MPSCSSPRHGRIAESWRTSVAHLSSPLTTVHRRSILLQPSLRQPSAPLPAPADQPPRIPRTQQAVQYDGSLPDAHNQCRLKLPHSVPEKPLTNEATRSLSTRRSLPYCVLCRTHNGSIATPSNTNGYLQLPRQPACPK
ncbi:hypothetical protein K505DRAFT_324747 [Melanomma pulvis-pyrius CBS 109.77]|uniref:Uncharacterized protein n=1 Tax=Melanomma pulvis-pyrius CBS 109.77 TaxID=1314802 RepID=A0A6A6XFI4_9PLEO|nr:hypothetical protein K505DRAFT_324747 [Melanomma pulvis-pyrius CBS 109.77]